MSLTQPLGLNAVYTIAAAFIKSCPSTICSSPGNGLPISDSRVRSTNCGWCCYRTQTKVRTSVQLRRNFCLRLRYHCSSDPVHQGRYGHSPDVNEYERTRIFFLTKDNSGSVTDANVIFGPAIIEVTPGAPTFDLTIM